MSKAALLAINAKYEHSSLAARLLAAGAEHYARLRHEISVVEAAVKQNDEDITALIAACRPDVMGISVYIWNAGRLPELLGLLRRRLPGAVFVLGGPEASHNAGYWLERGADYVLRGEGERGFPALLDALAENDVSALEKIPGLCYRQGREIIINELPAPSGDNVDPYDEASLKALEGRIAYIEASRGCPFSCAYCLSGGESLRIFPLGAVKERIKKLSGSGAKTIKFVDRTFNCDAARAYELLEYVIGLDTDRRFHFEVAADLFDGRTLSLLKKAPPGRIRLEAGLQSFYKPALEAVSRRCDLEKAEENIRTILSGRNIHVHVDLIAGLPLETLEDFKGSFERAYALGAHTLQLGFLKLLHGSGLRARAEELGIIYGKEPPYEIMFSPWLSAEDLLVLKRTENALQSTYNRGRFLSALAYALAASGLRPFDFYLGLGEAADNFALPLDIYAGEVYNYCAGLPGVGAERLRDHMVCDFLQMTRGKSMPSFLKSRGAGRKRAVREAEELLGRVIDYDEAEVLTTGEVVFADSQSRDAVTGLYRIFGRKGGAAIWSVTAVR